MTNTDTTKKRITPTKPVNIIVEREFIGTKSLLDVFIPVIYEDICKAAEQIHTLDSGKNSA